MLLVIPKNRRKNYFAKPIVLPRGIFDKKPTYIHEQKIEDAPEKYADWYRYCYDKTHKFQKFYTLDRDYTELFSDYQANIQTNKLNKKNLTHQQMFELFRMKQDLVIKKVMHKDLFIKLMIDYLFKNIFEQDINIGLNDIYQTKDERLRNQQLALKQKDREKGDTSENIKNINFIWNKTISLTLFNGQVKAAETKLKDIGKLRKLETDIKVHQILAYDSEKTWDKLMLEDELENRNDSYEKIAGRNFLKQFKCLKSMF